MSTGQKNTPKLKLLVKGKVKTGFETMYSIKFHQAAQRTPGFRTVSKQAWGRGSRPGAWSDPLGPLCGTSGGTSHRNMARRRPALRFSIGPQHNRLSRRRQRTARTDGQTPALPAPSQLPPAERRSWSQWPEQPCTQGFHPPQEGSGISIRCQAWVFRCLPYRKEPPATLGERPCQS